MTEVRMSGAPALETPPELLAALRSDGGRELPQHDVEQPESVPPGDEP